MRIKLYYTILLSFSIAFSLQAQFDDYIGAGNASGISVQSSSEEGFSRAIKTINGKGMDADLMEASRFLSQATFGYDKDEIEKVAEIGFEAWIEEQFFMPFEYLTPMMFGIWDEIKEAHERSFNIYLGEYINELCEAAENDPNIDPPNLTQQEVDDLREFYNEDIFGPYGLHFNYAWSHNMMSNKDQLRQRVAYALSQILVVSSQSSLGDHAETLTAFYDILTHHSFGNFKDILSEITVNPAMASYLSHLNNSKAIPEENIHPDENYARELMQLFTIGLYELNLDGSRKQDSNGFDIPTYNNNDIKELARVFTGLAAGSTDPRMPHVTWNAHFGISLYSMNKTEPLIMYQDYHDTEAKSLLNGLEIPANQNGMDDIEMAIDYLFNHPNVGPFIGRQLIQRLVKSNPSPQYIERVASVFNDNGFGERGDLQAVVKAILLDPEARSCDDLMSFGNGKLREPVLRSSEYLKAFDLYGEKREYTVWFDNYTCEGLNYTIDTILVMDDLRYWNNGYNFYDKVRQYPLLSPSVFNFYLPDHQPVGEIEANDLVAPEFKIHDSSTAVNYINEIWMYSAPYYDIAWYNWIAHYGFEDIKFNYNEIAEIYERDPELLIHEIDVQFTNGQMTDELKQVLRQFNEDLPNWVKNDYPEIPAKGMLYLMMWAPDYTISK